jgi:hypothetical protein
MDGKLTKQQFLKNVLATSLHEERMDLWGEYEHLTDEEVISLVLPALKMSHWKTLDLRRSHLTLSSVQALTATSFENDGKEHLKQLCLGSTGVGNEGMHLLASALINSQQLVVLNLFDNAIGDDGVIHLAQILKYTKLQTLNLDSNEITDKGVLALAKASSECCLEVLSLDMNNIADTGVKSLQSVLKVSCLRKVSLKGNLRISSLAKKNFARSMNVLHSEWYQLAIVLRCARLIPRLGASGQLSQLPEELVRKTLDTMFSAKDIKPSVRHNKIVAKEQRRGYEEDFAAAISYEKRRCNQNLFLDDVITKDTMFHASNLAVI